MGGFCVSRFRAYLKSRPSEEEEFELKLQKSKLKREELQQKIAKRKSADVVMIGVPPDDENKGRRGLLWRQENWFQDLEEILWLIIFLNFIFCALSPATRLSGSLTLVQNTLQTTLKLGDIREPTYPYKAMSFDLSL